MPDAEATSAAPAIISLPATEPKTEATPAPEVKPPSPKEDPKLSARFALLSKKEQAIYREKQAIKAERAAIDADRKETADLRARMAAGKSDPIAALQAAGYTYEQATEFVLNDKKPTADLGVKAVRDELGEMKSELQRLREEREAEAVARKKAEESAVMAEFNGKLASDVRAAGDKYELVNLYGAYEIVTNLVLQHHQATGELLSTEEAATLAEQYIEDWVSKAKSAKKFATPAAPSKPSSDSASQPGKGPQRTLTNSLGSTASTTAKPTDPIERALAAWGGNSRE